MHFILPPLPSLLVLSLCGYLCGSLPFGYWLSRFSGRTQDIRTHGSLSTGTTNVWRVAGKTAALLTLLLDVSKGFVPTFLALLWNPAAAPLVGIFTVLGHIFPLFLGFRGGKGVASMLGVLLAFSPLCSAGLFLFWLIILGITRYVSVASLGASCAAPFVFFMSGNEPLGLMASLLSVLLFWTHRANIGRLLRREEPRMGRGARVA